MLNLHFWPLEKNTLGIFFSFFTFRYYVYIIDTKNKTKFIVKLQLCIFL